MRPFRSFRCATDKLVDRYAFHLENVAGQDLQTDRRGVLPRVLRGRAEHPARDRRSAGRSAGLPRSRSSCHGAAARASRCARPCEARSGGSRSSLRRTRELALDLGGRGHGAAALSRGSPALEELREALNLESLPVRIECFDISTTQGRQTVGSMVGLLRMRSRRSAHYRKFAVRRQAGPGRLRRARAKCSRAGLRGPACRRRAADWDESFAAVPNLVVVDGGKGQLSAALEAMREFDLPRVAVISLAKREEEVFVPGVREPIVLDRSSAGLQLLQRLRDEAHRFAVGYHRQRRNAAARDSLLDHLARRRAGPAARPPQHFGSVERILAASQEELEGVPGFPPKTARAVYAQLHKAGRAVTRTV